VLAAVINYELDQVEYLATVPASLIETSILTAMLPYLVAAILSFAVAFLISRAIKSEAEKEPETQEKETETPT
jgi:biotin transporter BioY